MFGAKIQNYVITGINYLTAGYTGLTEPAGFIKCLQNDSRYWKWQSPAASCCLCAEFDVSVFRDLVMPTVLMRFWRFVLYFAKNSPSRANSSSWVFRVKPTASSCILHYSNLTTNWHVFSSVCVLSFFFFLTFFLPGNDSVMAPSTDSHPHPLQNWTLQVSIPHQGQHCTSACV